MIINHLNKNFRDKRFLALILALLTMIVLFIKPQSNRSQEVYNFTIIVDITRSMNARDYQINAKPVSRLTFIKHQLKQLLFQLPCHSKIGLGVFTDRQPTLLFEPIEICSSRYEITQAIDHLDWRMAWAADSRISKGLYKTIEMLQSFSSTLVFITDGQEAPPVNPRYRTDFSDLKEKTNGIIIGSGGLTNVPIPKHDPSGKQIGFYTADEVPHRSTFGIPSQLPSNAGNYHARNAPFGGAKVTGDQHMSRLYESYLTQLAKETGWQYHRLENFDKFIAALQQPMFAIKQRVKTDIRNLYAAFALCLLIGVYMPWKVQ